MSTLIKGMSKPKTCDDCIVPLSKCDYLQKRADDCPIIEIPIPHGRLIDADELKEKRETMCWKDEYYMTHESDFIDSRHIDNAPTILDKERV